MDSAPFLAAACLVLLAFSFMGNQKTKQRLKRLEEEVARLSGRPAGVAGSPHSVSNPVDPTVPGDE